MYLFVLHNLVLRCCESEVLVCHSKTFRGTIA